MKKNMGIIIVSLLLLVVIVLLGYLIGIKDRPETKDDKQLNYILNNTVKRVSDDIEKRFNFNTAISAIMELTNEIYRYKELEDINLGLLRDAIEYVHFKDYQKAKGSAAADPRLAA